jgi:hypothetical protein
VKKVSVFLATLAIVLAFGLAFTACGDDGGGGGLVTTLKLSGPVISENYNVSPPIDEPYSGPRIPLSLAGGQGEISSNGQLSFTIGTPDVLGNLSEGSGFLDSHFQITQVSVPAKFFHLNTTSSLTGTYSASYWLDKWDRYRNSQNKRVHELEKYVYTDTDVTVTGTGGVFSSGKRTTKYTDFTVNLKEGWNTILMTRVFNDEAQTDVVESIKIGSISSPSFYWSLEKN